MICLDGYRAFHGTMRITPTAPGYRGFEVTGDFLYKPEYKCWYCQPFGGGLSVSYEADICEIVDDMDER